jgi:hypothetical protein
MIAETSRGSHFTGFHAKNQAVIPERDTLRKLLHRLHKRIADQSRLSDTERDTGFVFFGVPLDLDLDDIDFCVHEGHVVNRMLR